MTMGEDAMSNSETTQPSLGPTDGPAPSPSVPPMALLPCPWCGVTESLEVYCTHMGYDAKDNECNIHYVVCDRCGAEGPSGAFASEAEAWNAWNTRAKGSNVIDETGCRCS
jgi:Lar family restriction alleviation protein